MGPDFIFKCGVEVMYSKGPAPHTWTGNKGIYYSGHRVVDLLCIAQLETPACSIIGTTLHCV